MIRFLVIYKQVPQPGMHKAYVPMQAELAVPILAGSEKSAKTIADARMRGNADWTFSRVIRENPKTKIGAVRASGINKNAKKLST